MEGCDTKALGSRAKHRREAAVAALSNPYEPTQEEPPEIANTTPMPSMIPDQSPSRELLRTRW